MSGLSHFTRRFRVGKSEVKFRAALSLDFEWCPFPSRLSRKRREEYLAKRDGVLAALAAHIGGSVAVATPGIEDGLKRIAP